MIKSCVFKDFYNMHRFKLPVRNKAKLIDGKSIAKECLKKLKDNILYSKIGRKPQLTAILVGENPASNIYVRNKMKAASSIGINSETVYLKGSISQEELMQTIEKLNDDNNVDGILLQLPLPEHISTRIVCDSISDKKDVDGFTSTNIGKFCLGLENTFVPCTAIAVYELIKSTGISLKGKNAVVCGRSKHVGLPIALLLHSDSSHKGLDATTTICHHNTPLQQLASLTRNADVVVSAAGVPGLIKGDMIKEGAIVIDVGITRSNDGGSSKIVGDVDFNEVKEIAGYITPVPGGVGPMTIAMLMRNTVLAAYKKMV